VTWGARDVSVLYAGRPALVEVTVDLRPGQIAIVVGGDGAGKTTLCRSVVGLEAVAGGRVSRPARTCFQPETSGVWPELTVMENLEFVARGYALDRSPARSRIAELLEVTDLADARDRPGRQLSGGMRQKLGVAMAVLSEPELLVLDEPTTGLDPVSRLELWSFIDLSARQGRAVLVTSTYLDEATRADVVTVLDEGRVLTSGSVAEIISEMPGRIFVSDRKIGMQSWRRGASWRAWSETGDPIPGAREVEPDLTDVVTVAALAGEQR